MSIDDTGIFSEDTEKTQGEISRDQEMRISMLEDENAALKDSAAWSAKHIAILEPIAEKAAGLEVENAELRRRLDEETALFHAALTGQTNAFVENTELSKRLECPKLKWRNGDAWMGGYNIGDVTFSAFDDAHKGWLFGMEANRESFKTEAEAKAAVENAWLEFWNRIHGGSK